MSPICIQHLGPGVVTIYRPTTRSSTGSGFLTNPTNAYDTDINTYSQQGVSTDYPSDPDNILTTVYSGWAGGTKSGKLVVRREVSGNTDDNKYAFWEVFIDYSTDAGANYTTLETSSFATGDRALGDIEVSLSSISSGNLRVRVRTTVSGGADEFENPYNASAQADIYDIRFEEF